jgi:hypothetical protein
MRNSCISDILLDSSHSLRLFFEAVFSGGGRVRDDDERHGIHRAKFAANQTHGIGPSRFEY